MVLWTPALPALGGGWIEGFTKGLAHRDMQTRKVTVMKGGSVLKWAPARRLPLTVTLSGGLQLSEGSKGRPSQGQGHPELASELQKLFLRPLQFGKTEASPEMSTVPAIPPWKYSPCQLQGQTGPTSETCC